MKNSVTESICMIIPDNGPQQHDLARLIRRLGFDVGLYDGLIENDVNTSTRANWRWKAIYIHQSEYKVYAAYPGDSIKVEGQNIFVIKNR